MVLRLEPRHRIFQKPNSDGMENFTEGIVADLLRSGPFNQRQGKLFAEDGNGQRVGFYLFFWISAGSSFVPER